MTKNTHTREGNRSIIGSFLVLWLYQFVENLAMRSFLRRLVLRLEGGPIYSLTIREVFRRFHGVNVGLYTIGPCDVDPGNLAPGTTIGRYSSIYYTVRTIVNDHATSVNRPLGRIRCSAMDETQTDSNVHTQLEIGNDVFIGHNAIILPSVGRIGDGAFIGAGSVVSNTVPPYAVVTGNPARVVRYRFSEGKIKELLASEWWLKTIDQLSASMEEFQKPLEGETIR